MIHAKRGVVIGPGGGVEHGVGRVGAGHPPALGPQRLDRGNDQFDLLAPQRAAFAGMGIESGHRQPRVGNPEIALQAAQRRPAARFDQARRSALAATAPSGMWVVTGTVRSVGPASIIATLAGETPQRSATNSVWPGWLKPMP